MNARSETTSGTVARSVELLRYFAEHRETSIKQLSTRLSLAPSTCHRLLDILMREGLVEQERETRRYRIGPEFFRIASLVQAGSDVRALARPYLDEVVKECDETAVLCLYIAATHKLIFAEKVDSGHLLRYQMPLNVPTSVLWGATGRAVLAFLTEEEIDSILSEEGEAPASGEAVPGRGDLVASLEQIRHQGFAISFGEKIAGAVGITSPVFGPQQRVIGSIGVTVPSTRIDAQGAAALAPMIRRVGMKLSMALGVTPTTLSTLCPAFTND